MREIKIAEELKDRVYLDEADRILYIDNRDLYKLGAFLSYLEELRSHFANLKVIEDREKVREGLQKRKDQNTSATVYYTESERSLAELERILRKAASRFVSDIHIEIKRKDLCEVYFREEGEKREEEVLRGEGIGDTIAASIFNISGASSHGSFSPNRFQYAQITSFSMDRTAGREIKLRLPEGVEGIRVQRGPMHGGHFVVLRLFYRDSRLSLERGNSFEETLERTLRKYGYKPSTIERVRPTLEAGDGLTIVAGPTNSGKSTALKLFLELIHELYPFKSIFTIENPPEYTIKGAKQLPVPEEGSFAEVLRVALRSDPDIIMVGEVREPETAKTVVDAVLTGHQVFTTVHARDVPTIVDRLMGLGVDLRTLAEDNLVKLLVAQRLLPRNCPRCRVAEDFGGIRGYRGKGCPECNGKGIKGRAVVEECVNFLDIKEWGIDRLREKLLDTGRNMMINGLRLVLEGEVSPKALVAQLGYWTQDELEIARARQ